MLFGHQNDTTSQPVQATPVVSDAGVNPLAVDPATGASLPVASPPPPPPPQSTEPSVLNQPVTPIVEDVAPSAPTIEPVLPFAAPTPDFPPAPTAIVNPTTEPEPTPTLDAPVETSDTAAPALPITEEPADETPAVTAAADDDTDSSEATESDTETPSMNSDLVALKQQALAELQPLVDQLDQTPEERFRTTMMLIQSTDNQSLIQDAYEAAQQITDEKVRARALLDVINEINYFTQAKPAS